MSRRPRWPRQVQWSLSYVGVVGSKLRQCKCDLKMGMFFFVYANIRGISWIVLMHETASSSRLQRSSLLGKVFHQMEVLSGVYTMAIIALS